MNACSRLIVSALLAVFSSGAAAVATLTYSWSNVTCDMYSTYYGPVFSEPCTTPSITALVQPGQQLVVEGLFSYVYHDDGLPLDRVELFQVDGTGFVQRRIYNEAGGLFFASSWCKDSRYCAPDPPFRHEFLGIRSIVLGDNQVPDDLSGEIRFSVLEGLTPDAPGPRILTAFVAPVVHTFSAVSAIPESSTSALLLAGLLAVGIVARRRRPPIA